MALLNAQIRKDVQAALADVQAAGDRSRVFTQEIECQYCKETRELVEEVAALSDKLSVEVYDFEKDERHGGERWDRQGAGGRRRGARRTTASACLAFRRATSSAA